MRYKLKTGLDMMCYNPKQALSVFHHQMIHATMKGDDVDAAGRPRFKHMMAQQGLVYAAILASSDPKTANTSAIDTTENQMKVHTDLPTDLPMAIVPGAQIAQKVSPVDVDPNILTGAAIEPEFIPPTPSRTIPIIHDGLEWDEPNFLIKPFVNVIDLLHDTSGLPWWGTLVSWAWILRTTISPLTYKQQVSTVKFTLLQPESIQLNTELRKMEPGSAAYKDKQAQIAALYKKHGVGPFTAVFWSLASIPFYILSFLSIRNMANSPYFAGEFATGGFAPYMNISASAGWELAAVNACVNLLMLHASQPVPTHKMPKLQKIMFMMSHVIVFATIPLLANINTASIFYFIANNSFSIFFQKLFYSNTFRKVAGLPSNDEVQAVRDIVTQMQSDPTKANQPPEGANKGAYILQDGKQKTAQKQEDILEQARRLVKEEQEKKKAFALGGEEGLAKLKKEKEAAEQKKKDEADMVGNLSMAELKKQQDFKMGRIAGYNLHEVNSSMKPEKSSAKTVARKGWKKH